MGNCANYGSSGIIAACDQEAGLFSKLNEYSMSRFPLPWPTLFHIKMKTCCTKVILPFVTRF